MHDALFALWFLAPAALANVAPIVAAKTPTLKQYTAPIDGGRTLHGKPILGPNKTWRGIICGIVVSTLVFWLQHLLDRNSNWFHQLSQGIDFQALPTFILGPLFGLGALGGDAIESFLKRQRGIGAGETWIPFDQLDYIIGGVLVSLPFVLLSFWQYVWIFLIYFVTHLVASFLGWQTGFKERPI